MSRTVDICESEIRFKVKNSLIRFKIYHNLPNVMGMNIEGALDNWLSRTHEFSAKSLCNYILSKEICDVVAFTEKEFNQLKKERKVKSA